MSRLSSEQLVVAPNRAEETLARRSSACLESALETSTKRELKLEIRTGEAGESVTLPHAAARVLARVLAELGKGRAVTVTSLDAELTTAQAARVLGVSRPHVVKLLDAGEIPSRKVGTHRRVRMDDLLRYQDSLREKRQEALRELAALGQELGLGY